MTTLRKTFPIPKKKKWRASSSPKIKEKLKSIQTVSRASQRVGTETWRAGTMRWRQNWTPPCWTPLALSCYRPGSPAGNPSGTGQGWLAAKRKWLENHLHLYIFFCNFGCCRPAYENSSTQNDLFESMSQDFVHAN